jgi:hypothetical protein
MNGNGCNIGNGDDHDLFNVARTGDSPLPVSVRHRPSENDMPESRVAFDGRPNEVPNPIPFAEDTTKRTYAAEVVTRFTGC